MSEKNYYRLMKSVGGHAVGKHAISRTNENGTSEIVTIRPGQVIASSVDLSALFRHKFVRCSKSGEILDDSPVDPSTTQIVDAETGGAYQESTTTSSQKDPVDVTGQYETAVANDLKVFQREGLLYVHSEDGQLNEEGLAEDQLESFIENL